MLRGRATECAQLDALVGQVQSGRSQALVLHGEAGMGKTALLDYVAEHATGWRVARVSGVESEMELAYAAVHHLCGPMFDLIDRLPAPQRDALRVVFGIADGGVPDRFLVALALLTLVAETAADRPLLCVVDDAQWVDRASLQALSFVARRLFADRVAMLFAARDHSREDDLRGLPDIALAGISDHEARLLLEETIPGRLDEQVRQRIIADARGNPLALLELPRGLTPAALAGGFGLPETQLVTNRIEQSFAARLATLPRNAQLVLLVAAAEPIGDVALLWQTVERLGLSADAVALAEEPELIDIGTRVRFRHPLVRAAIYGLAAPRDRQRVHQALADVTDAENDPDRRAWHRAHATEGLDELVADELEHCAHRARARGGIAATAAFLERSTQLTPDPARRSRRALAAADAKLASAAPDVAADLLAIAEMGSLDELQRARLERLRAQTEFVRTRGRNAPPLLVDAAKRLAPLDAALARQTYLDALEAAIYAGRLSDGTGVLQAAEAAVSAPPSSQPPSASDLLLDGLAKRFTKGYEAAVPQLREALSALRRDDSCGDADNRWLWLACRVAPDIWDDEAWHELASRHIRFAREQGALSVLPIAASARAGVYVHGGEFDAAAAAIDQAETVTAATGGLGIAYTSLVIAAWRGDERVAVPIIQRTIADAEARGEGRAVALGQYATAVLYNGLARYDDARVAAQRVCAYDDLGLSGWALIELIEAAIRSKRPGMAATAFAQLAEHTSASRTDWALGIEARCRALLDDDDPEGAYREAIERLSRTRIVVHLARSHLLYGEWLRRAQRRGDARDHLRSALEKFVRMGATAFAERARRELQATGETVRKRTSEARDQLTAQEAQIARLARDGLTNSEIGAQLFISPRTVEYHLAKVFTKLNISTRRELRHALAPV
jgi:DNA-binding CsgD family transcriptional regulator/tetratricopeptide (TPR) repeat protein